MPAPSGPGSVTRYALIDGQQRLTTMFVLPAVLRDMAAGVSARLAERIDHVFLFNRFEEDEEDRYKFLPTPAT